MSLKRVISIKSDNNEGWYIFDQSNHQNTSYSKNDLFVLFMNGKLKQNSYVCHPKNTNNKWVMLNQTKYYAKLKKYYDMFVSTVIKHKTESQPQLFNNNQRIPTKLLPTMSIQTEPPKLSLNSDVLSAPDDNDDDDDAFISSLADAIHGHDDESETKTVCHMDI